MINTFRVFMKIEIMRWIITSALDKMKSFNVVQMVYMRLWLLIKYPL